MKNDKKPWEFSEIMVVIIIIALVCGNFYSCSRTAQKSASEEAYKEGYLAGYEDGYNDGIEGEDCDSEGGY